MLNIAIDRESTVVENPDYHVEGVNYPIKWTLKTTCFFGNVFATLEKHFPDINQDNVGERIAAHVVNALSGKVEDDPVKIFGYLELGESLIDLKSFIGEDTNFVPTLKKVEDFRVAHRMTVNYLPTGIDKGGMRFEGLKTVSQVMVAALYYYAYHEYKLVRCKHCGKWFATKKGKKNGEEEYCCRQSPFEGYEKYPCKEAVKAIKDMLEKRRISEYKRLRLRAEEYGVSSTHYQVFNDFCTSCNSYKARLKKSASVELLQEYKDFLYDSENVRPKYKRIKNW